MAEIKANIKVEHNAETIPHVSNEWQLCPKCSGTGTMMQTLPGYVITTNATCDLCRGKMVISKITAQPPD